MTPEFYICECCGGTFEKGWTDEEAMREAAGIFPEIEKAIAAVVCDDCYERLMELIKKASDDLKNDNLHQ